MSVKILVPRTAEREVNKFVEASADYVMDFTSTNSLSTIDNISGVLYEDATDTVFKTEMVVPSNNKPSTHKTGHNFLLNSSYLDFAITSEYPFQSNFLIYLLDGDLITADYVRTNISIDDVNNETSLIHKYKIIKIRKHSTELEKDEVAAISDHDIDLLKDILSLRLSNPYILHKDTVFNKEYGLNNEQVCSGVKINSESSAYTTFDTSEAQLDEKEGTYKGSIYINVEQETTESFPGLKDGQVVPVKQVDLFYRYVNYFGILNLNNLNDEYEYSLLFNSRLIYQPQNRLFLSNVEFDSTEPNYLIKHINKRSSMNMDMYCVNLKPDEGVSLTALCNFANATKETSVELNVIAVPTPYSDFYARSMLIFPSDATQFTLKILGQDKTYTIGDLSNRSVVKQYWSLNKDLIPLGIMVVPLAGRSILFINLTEEEKNFEIDFVVKQYNNIRGYKITGEPKLLNSEVKLPLGFIEENNSFSIFELDEGATTNIASYVFTLKGAMDLKRTFSPSMFSYTPNYAEKTEKIITIPKIQTETETYNISITKGDTDTVEQLEQKLLDEAKKVAGKEFNITADSGSIVFKPLVSLKYVMLARGHFKTDGYQYSDPVSAIDYIIMEI